LAAERERQRRQVDAATTDTLGLAEAARAEERQRCEDSMRALRDQFLGGAEEAPPAPEESVGAGDEPSRREAGELRKEMEAACEERLARAGEKCEAEKERELARALRIAEREWKRAERERRREEKREQD
jgi:hypothetical protein